jgi:undecaprenyl-diphosphatase
MTIISGRFTWIPLYLLFAILIIKDNGRGSWLIILFAVIAVVLSDQISNLIKNEVMRLRPSHQPGVMNQLHYVNDSNGEPQMGGMYSFVSNHAANSSSLATYLILLFRNKFVTLGLLLWMLLICYSRIYLGLHYPSDVICGIILGIILGSFARYSCKLLERGTSFTDS